CWVALDSLALISAYELSLGQHVPLHGLLNFFLASPFFEAGWRIQSVDLEEIAMCLAGRWCRTAIAHFPKIIAALFSATGQRSGVRNTFWQFVCLARQIVDYPVNPGLGSWRIWIVANQCEAFRTRRSPGPLQGRRNIIPITSALFGYRLPFPK